MAVAAGKFIVAGIRNDGFVTDGFLHYNTTTNEVVYNSVGGGGGGGPIFSASTIIGFNSLIAPTQFFAQELYTTNTYNFSQLGLTVSTAATSESWRGVAVSASGQYMLAATSTNLYSSSNFGFTWTQVATTEAWRNVAMSASGKIQYATIDNGIIYGSSDYGVTWTGFSTYSLLWRGITTSASGQYITCVEVTDSQIWTSIDFGNSFQNNNPLLTGVWSSVQMSASGQIQTATINGGLVYGSTNYGQAWASVGLPSDSYTGVAMSASGQYQTVTSVTTGSGSGSIRTSSNFGANWTTFSIQAVDYTNVCMSASGQYQMVSINGGAIIQSSDYGASWTSSNFPTGPIWTRIAMSAAGNYTVAVAPSNFINIASLPQIIPSLETSSLGVSSLTAYSVAPALATISTANISTANISTANVSTAQVNGLSVSSATISSIVANNVSSLTSQSGALTTSSITANNINTTLANISSLTVSSIGATRFSGAVNMVGLPANNVLMTTGQQQILLSNSANSLYAYIEASLSNAPNAPRIRIGSWAGGGQALTLNESGGNVGIGSGMTNPQFTLDVVGTANFLSTLTRSASISSANISTAQVNSLTMSSLTTSSIVANNVSSLTSQSGALTTSSIVTNNVSSLTSQSGALTTSSIVTNNVSSLTSQSGALTVSSIVGNNVSSLTSQSGALTTSSIVTNNVSSLTSQSGALTVSSIVANNVSSLTTQSGALTVSSITANNTNTTVANISSLAVSSIGATRFSGAVNMVGLPADNVLIRTTSQQILLSNPNSTIMLYADAFQATPNRVRFFAYGNGTGANLTLNELGGNVGIGSNMINPQFTLDVVGTANFISTLTRFTSISSATISTINNATNIQGNLNLPGGGTAFTIPTLGSGYRAFGLSGGNSYGFLYGAFQSLNDGIHLSYNYINCNLGNASNFIPNTPGRTSQITLGQGQIIFNTSITSNTIPTERFRIAQDGNIGIGTSSPQFLLDVNGTANFNGAVTMPNLPANNVLMTSGQQQIILSNSATGIYSYYQSAASNSPIAGSAPRIRIGSFSSNGQALTLNESGGNVGIGSGMSNPLYTLDVNGTANLRGIRVVSNTQQSFLSSATSSIGLFVAASDSPTICRILSYGNSAGRPLYLNDNGGIVVIGTTSSITSSFGLYVQGSIYTSGTYASSDQRVKEDIINANTTLCYSTMQGIDLKYFKWNSSFQTSSKLQDAHQLGFIAQDIKKVFPNSVHISQMNGYDDFHALETGQINAVHFGATKKLMTVVEQQTAQLQHQSTQIANLLADNSTLTSMCAYIPQLMNTVSTLKG